MTRVVTLCGSTRFKQAYLEAEDVLERQGVAVFTVGSFMHADGLEFTDEQKEVLDALHLFKIDKSDSILVLNVGGYIGDSTRREIRYALAHGKRVEYLEEPVDRPEVGWFAERMEAKLLANGHKTEWATLRGIKVWWFYDRIREEVKELESAMADGGPNEVIDECVDVANLAMMLADVTRSRRGLGSDSG